MGGFSIGGRARMSEPARATSRLFIAVSPGVATQREFDAAVQALKVLPQHAGLRLLRPEKRHFTLRFLGQVPDSQRAAICRACAETAAESAPFELMLAAAGAFPRASRGTVLWVGVGQGAGELVRLAQRLNARLDLLGYPPEQRPYVPHLTIARSRRPQQLTAAVEALATLRIPTRVGEIALIRSRLGGPESTYDTVDSFALSGTQ
jgi:RNA 2',3'-cyclic 3'-phosphodiesterase